MTKTARIVQKQLDDPVPLARRMGVGVAAADRDTWSDPDDVVPDAKKAPRQIHGWRAPACPLRRMMKQSGSQVTPLHLLAADKLRLYADVARYGLTAEESAVRSAPGPRLGPTVIATNRADYDRKMKRALEVYTEDQRRMLSAVLLECVTVPVWCAQETKRRKRRFNAQFETGRLVALLDILATRI